MLWKGRDTTGATWCRGQPLVLTHFDPEQRALIRARGSVVERQEASERSGFRAECGSVCTRLQKRGPSFHQIFKAIRNQKPLRVTGLGIFSFFLFLLTDTNADTPLPRTKSS